MGLAGLVVGAMIALVIVVAVVYGIFVGLARFGGFLRQVARQVLVVEGQEDTMVAADEQPTEKEVAGSRQ